jgi:hypothetical protein
VTSLRTLLPWFWPLALATTIFLASGRGTVASPDIVGIDKVAHFGLFGLLAMLVVRNGFPPRRAWIAVALVALFGLTDEWHQSFTPGRYVEIADWVADTLGAIVAVTVYVRWPRVRGWLETPLPVRQRRIEKTAALVPNQSA